MLGRDSRRIQGPSESKPISQFIKDDHENNSERLLCDENGQRADGRRLDEIRPVYLRTGEISIFDASKQFLGIDASKSYHKTVWITAQHAPV